MFTRHMIAAAALMAATFSAHADVISTSPDALISSGVITGATVSSSSLAANMNIVDGGTSLNGTDLTSLLAASSTAQLYLVRGVEGLYMLASRVVGVPDATSTGAPAALPESAAITIPAAAETITPAADADTGATTPALVSIEPPLAADAPVVLAAEVPEPSSLALLLAGVLGAVAFTRARKQG